MAQGDAREGKLWGNWRMEWVASTLHTIPEHGVSSITTADKHTSAAVLKWTSSWSGQCIEMDFVLKWTVYCSGHGPAVNSVLKWTTSWSGQHPAVDRVLKWTTSGNRQRPALANILRLALDNVLQRTTPALDSVLQNTTYRSAKPHKKWTTSWNGIGQTPFTGQRLAMYKVLQWGTSRDGLRPRMDNCNSFSENIDILYKSSVVSIAYSMTDCALEHSAGAVKRQERNEARRH
jgi:hypothetical protein